MRAFTLALDRPCDVINNNNSRNKLSIKSFEVLSEMVGQGNEYTSAAYT